jgi:hypothetical protein
MIYQLYEYFREHFFKFNIITGYTRTPQFVSNIREWQEQTKITLMIKLLDE